ncbi:hypothetical protein AMTR_s00096p00098430 [Amborella trichopoda]|uniref:Uncharacterized protein n=1 Tax=Amborella trichopoda TaxID=13333 RepID=W1P394_AMBTC|nr:hypothetical protein AMTR_s00096p00098430 [Amborella trichopoda]
MPEHTSTVHRDQYDKLIEEQFTWHPYVDEEDNNLTILYKAIILNVLQKFGLTQDAPAFVPRRPVHKMKGGLLYASELQRARDRWAQASKFCADGVEGVVLTPSFRSWLEGEKVGNPRLFGMQATGWDSNSKIIVHNYLQGDPHVLLDCLMKRAQTDEGLGLELFNLGSQESKARLEATLRDLNSAREEIEVLKRRHEGCGEVPSNSLILNRSPWKRSIYRSLFVKKAVA